MTIPYDSNYDPAALILPAVLSGMVRHPWPRLVRALLLAPQWARTDLFTE